MVLRKSRVEIGNSGLGGFHMRQIMKHAFYLAVGIVLALLSARDAYAQATKTGTLADGATYLIEVPANWNGTLFLYSHGYVLPLPTRQNPAQDAGDPVTEAIMLSNGFALAGSSYATKGWAVQDALSDQIAVLDLFKLMVGQPTRTIAWGHSLGGMITAGLIQRNPDRFDAALPMCGVLSGGVATWNTALDSEFAFKTLIAPGSGLQMVHITDPLGNLNLAEAFLVGAQSSPQGRARLALVSALSDGPGWFDPTLPEPAEDDFASQEANQVLWDANVDFPFVFAFRAELEVRAGGNVSSNEGVDYRKQLARSIDREEVRALYEQAGLDLDGDLDMLNDTVRVSADPEALEYLEHNIIFDGEIHIPVLTMHTEGDGLVVVENESAYRKVVNEAGNAKFLRRTFVHRAGHCEFSPAETIAAVQTLLNRLDTGKWSELEANDLNQVALALGPGANIIFVMPQPGVVVIVPATPAFSDFKSSQYLRPFDALRGEKESREQ
jgi:pimeloyl-ACP methyl ester carboxylesterase